MSREVIVFNPNKQPKKSKIKSYAISFRDDEPGSTPSVKKQRKRINIGWEEMTSNKIEEHIETIECDGLCVQHASTTS